MQQWLTALVAPAIIASALTLLINIRLDKLKAKRDYVGLTFESAKLAIETAVKAAAAYYPLDASARTPVLEAALWLADRELRLQFPTLLDNCSGTTKEELGKLQDVFDGFIGELTGGSFQVSTGKADLKHLRKIASAGADLRSQLTAVRHMELKRALDRDIMSRLFNYLSESRGITSKESLFS